ncbi:MAG: lnt [Acidobacteria bacterium]|nr:lnt [Acidobacteriota bacterium]
MSVEPARPARDRGRLALAALGGLLVGLAFPKPGWGPLVVAGFGLAFFLAASARGARRAARDGAVFGFVATVVTLRWFSTPILLFSTLGASIAWTAVVLSGLTLAALAAALFAILDGWARRWGPGRALALAPFLLTAYDLVREWFPFPFPWGAPAAALARWSWVQVGAGAVGAAGVSWLLYALAAILASGARAKRRRAALMLGGWLLAAGLVFALGTLSAPGRAGQVRVAVLQASLPRDAETSLEWETYRGLTAEAARAGAEIVVWPESAVSYHFDAEGKWAARLAELASRERVDLVVGGLTRSPSGRFENSSVLVRADRGLAAKAPKRQLVPFGEYMPLRFLFGRIPALANEVGEFQPGADAVVFESQRVRIGPLVCFEAVFPGLTVDLVEKGARLLVNQTNDSWFGTTGGPRQHFEHGLLRAAETGLPLARAANSGISALVDGGGAVHAELGTGEKGILVADLAVPERPRPGAATGRAVAWAALVLTAVALAGIVPRRSPPIPRAATATGTP